ncbi:hypothetical protein SBY92_002274 [Candida maltosa Xu316]
MLNKFNISNLYFYLIVFTIGYLIVILALNLIPHFNIKYIGLGSLRGVTITTSSKIIKIRKLSIRFNLFKSHNSSGFKLVNLEIVDLSITLLKKPSIEKSNKPKKPKKKLEDISISKELHFKLPKVVYDLLFKTKIINKINIHLFRTSISSYKNDKVSIFLDYIRFECNLQQGNNTRFTITSFNGLINDTSEKSKKVSLFRNIEFFINCQTIASCGMFKEANTIFVHLSDFKNALSIGRLNIPLEYFKKPKKEKVTPVTTGEDNDDTPQQKPMVDIIKYKNLLIEVMQVYNTTEIRLEDFTLSHDQLSANLSNFVLNLDKVEKDDEVQNLKLSLYLTSFKFYHIGTQCFELPSGTFYYEVCPLEFLKVSQALLNHDKNSFDTINFDFNLTLTNAVIDLYYDQLDIVVGIMRDKMIKKRMNVVRQAAGVHKKEEFFKKLDIASSLLRAISSRLVVVNTRVNIHIPSVNKDQDAKFNRYSKSNVTVTVSISELAFKFFTRLFKHENKLAKKKSSFNTLFKLKNLKCEAEGNKFHFIKVNLLAAYNITDKNVAIKFASKSLELKSVNDLIFHIVRQFRNRQIISFNKEYEKWRAANEEIPIFAPREVPQIPSLASTPGTSSAVLKTQPQFKELFKLLPHFVSSVKLDVSNILFDMVCKEGLPSHKMYDENLGKEIDLADFRRGISLKISNITVNYKLAKEFFETRVTSLQVFTLSEYSAEYMQDFDKVTEVQNNSDSDMSDLSSINTVESTTEIEGEGDVDEDNSNTNRIKNVLAIPEIVISNSSATGDERDPNKLTLTIPEIESRVDMFLLWCFFYVKTLMGRFKPTIESNYSKEQFKQLTKSKKKKFKLDVNLDSVAIVIRLPRKVDVMVEVDTAKLKNVFVLKSVDIKNVRLYVIDPGTQLWARLLIIKEPKFGIDFVKSIHDSSFAICTRSIRISVPNRFKFYTVIDNFITFFKTIKQLKSNFKYFNWGIDEFERLFPKERAPIIFPHLNIKTQVLGLELEGDPFENELAMIFEIGKIEQKERLRKWKEFEKRAQQIREESEDNDIENRIQLSDVPAPTAGSGDDPASEKRRGRSSSGVRGRTNSIMTRVQSPLRSVSPDNLVHSGTSLIKDKIFKRPRKPDQLDQTISEEYDENGMDSDKPKYTLSEAEQRIEDARQRLYKNFSASWTRKFKIFKATKIRLWKERSESIWGPNNVSDVMKKNFDIVDFNYGAPLAGAILRDVDLTLDKSKLKDIDQFLYDYAKHQPKLTYSIMCPLYIELKASKFYMILKDYPLPVASFPRSSDPSKPTVHLKTNLVINEKLFTRQEELRYIYVPISPAVPDNGKADNFYSVYIPRTLQPVKFAADIQCDINTDRACSISWCKAYQPAFTAMGMAFSNFSKPAIDDSPIGWWDKLPMILHGRVRFNISNELCLHMKSGRDPHELVGKNSGFVFSWKNNVTLTIDGTINSKDLVVIESDDFVFAIPNYSIEEKNIWSLFYDNLDDPNTDVDLEAKKFSKRVITLTSSNRVKWILGMLFERNKYKDHEFSDNELRVSEFKPHYEVSITNPANEYHPDSFEDYRSDYVHMALSVISNSNGKDGKGEAHNSAYLTPLAFHHFFYWWDSIAHYSPPPVKRGKLFAQDAVKKPKIKFSPHLFTMKYQLIFNPITISHLYMHSTSDIPKKKSKIAFTGLKGKFNICEIDLHQRKEYVTHENRKLNRTTKTRHLKMYQAEVNIEKADVRVLNAIFSDVSISGKLMSFLNHNDNSSSDLSTSSGSSSSNGYEKWIQTVDICDGDFSWVDPQDFVELEVREPLSPYPRIKIVPFFTTPKFSYYREFTLQKPGPFPFGDEKIHDCIMDLDKPAAVQSRILLERIDDLKEDLKNNEEKLRRYKIQNGPEYQDDIKHTEEEIRTLKEKIEVVNDAYNNFTVEGFDSLSPDGDDDSNSLSRTTTKLSAYTSHITADELAEASNYTSIAEFHNRFIIHNLQLKWDDDISKYFISYMHRMSERKNHIYYMTKYAVDLVEQVINEDTNIDIGTDNTTNIDLKGFKDNEHIAECFEDDLDEVSNPEEEAAEYKYLVKLIHPQIQLMSKKIPDSCVVLTSKDLELRIVDINLKERMNILSDNNEMTARIERRTGVLLTDEQLFVLNKSEVVNIKHSKFAKHGYMSDENNWPPWFECEVCYDGSWAHEYLISERSTLALISRSPNQMFVNNKKIQQGNEVVLYLSKYVINATSAQYSNIYYVITGLLLGGEGKKNETEDRFRRLIALADNSDFAGLDDKVKTLQYNIRDYKELLLNFDQKGAILSDEEKKYLHILELEMERSKLELLLIMKALQTRIKMTSKITSKCYEVFAGQVIWHMLDDDREPFVDFALANTRFIQEKGVDGTSSKYAEIGMVQGFNLSKRAMYPQLLSPRVDKEKEKLESCDYQKPVIIADWTTLEPVGGIPVIKSAKLEISPLSIELDYPTAKKLQNYLFPKDDDKDGTDDHDDSDSDDDGDETSKYIIPDDASVLSNESSVMSRNPLKRLMSKRKSSGSSTPSSSSHTSQTKSGQALTPRSSASSFMSQEECSVVGGIKYATHKLPHFRHNSAASRQLQEQQRLEDDLSVIIARSMKFKSIIDLEVKNFQLTVSFSANKALHLLDVQKLVLNVPSLKYSNKIWSAEELTDRMKKDVIKIILQHSGKILGNKLKVNGKTKKANEPLKQISSYSRYMTLDDLQAQGRERDSSTVDHEVHQAPKTKHKSHRHSMVSKLPSISKVVSRSSNHSTHYEDFLEKVDDPTEAK